MTAHFEHLGIYSDWVSSADQHNHLHPNAAPGAETRNRIREVLGFSYTPALQQTFVSSAPGPATDL